MCPLPGDLLSVTFDPETAEIRWRIVPPYENSAFSGIAGLPTQRPLNTGQPNFGTCYPHTPNVADPMSIVHTPRDFTNGA